jgi:hypothetical protein
MRNYKKERENYHSKPEQMLRNAARKRARRQMEKEGKAKIHDGKDVHHKDNNPLNNDKNNLSVVTQNYNRKEPRLREKKLKEMGTVTGPQIAGTGDDSSTVVVRKKKQARVQTRQSKKLKDRIKDMAGKR